jgi:hypothetical protein
VPTCQKKAQALYIPTSFAATAALLQTLSASIARSRAVNRRFEGTLMSEIGSWNRFQLTIGNKKMVYAMTITEKALV